jgi:hypothetical protein
MLREAISVCEASPSSHIRDNTLENPGIRAGNSHDGSNRWHLGLHCVIQ